MENDAERMPQSGENRADAVTHLDPISAACATHRTVIHRENDGASLLEWGYRNLRLHARPLLAQNKFSACKIVLRPG